jgi:predicted nucleotidyltransferase
MKEDGDEETAGVSISLRIPVSDERLFKHKATNDVILFLSRHSLNEYSISEIASYTGHTEPSVKRSVDVLNENGLVRDTPEGNKRLVQINQQRLSVPNDPYLQIPQKEFRKPVKEAAEEIESRLENVQAVVLYGSIARGEGDRLSDVDLWVLVSGDRPKQQRKANDIVRDMEEEKFDGDRYGFDIDVESVSSVPKYTDEIRQIVLSGIPIHNTEDFETVRNLLTDEVGEDE